MRTMKLLRSIKLRNIMIVLLTLIMCQFAIAKDKKKNGIKGEDGLYSCETAKTDLFKKENANDFLKIDFMMDPSSLTSQDQNKKISNFAILRINIDDNPENSEILPVGITTRGNSRARHCQYKPIRIHFIDEETIARLEKRIDSNLDKTSIEYLKVYFNELESMNPEIPWNGRSRESGIFKDLGDDIKFVTHCGKGSWEFTGAPTPAAQAERLLGEYYIYQIYNSVHLLVEDARLTRVNYINPNGTSMFDSSDGFVEGNFGRWGFFRETPKAMAKRCKLNHKIDANAPRKDRNYRSYAQVESFNKIINSLDYGAEHNTGVLYSADEGELVSAYDFDISGILVDGYYKNYENWSSMKRDIIRFIEDSNDEGKQIHAAVGNRFLLKSQFISDMIDSSHMGESMRNRFREWLQKTSEILTDVLNLPRQGEEVNMLKDGDK